MGPVTRTLHQTDVDVATLEDALGDGELTVWSWVTAGGTILAAVLLAQLVRLALTRVLAGRVDPVVAALIGRLTSFLVVTLGVLYGLDTLGVRVAPLLGALGIIGLAVAFALKDILENFVAGLLLQFRRPFSYGDEIVSGEVEGRVESIDARTVTVATPDGETVHLPSSQVITDAIVNHTQRGARRSEVEVGVAYGSDLEQVTTALHQALDEVEAVLAAPAPEVLMTGFGDSSLDFVVRFWHPPTVADHWHTRSDVALAIDRSLRAQGIEIPFPQQVLHVATDDDTVTTLH